MKKFSTAVLLLLLGFASRVLAGAGCEFSRTAPDSHRVRQGDTLWQIAAIFLENPWCWSTVWEINREQIRDPHWIYPGQTIFFDRERQQLRLHPNEVGPVARQSPSIRTEAVQATPLPLIAPELTRRLNTTALIPVGLLANAPQVAGIRDGRRMAAVSDAVIVSGSLEGQTVFQVIRPLQSVADPDTGRPLALSSLQVGTVYLESAGSKGTHQFRVASSLTEILIGDRLIPLAKLAQAQWVPHPARAFKGRIAAVLRGTKWAGAHDIVAINRGTHAGLDAGSVIAVAREARIPVHAGNYHPTVFAPEKIATLLVFDVTDHAALAVVMRASDTFTIGDAVESVDGSAR